MLDWRLASLRAEVEAYLTSFVGRPFRYYQNGGNAGDSIIALGTLHCFERLGLSYRTIGPHSPVGPEPIVFAGGGNLIDRYNFIHNGLLKHLDTAEEIIILPHTIRGNLDLLPRLGERVTIFCRDIDSYRHCHLHAGRLAKIFLGHDMAFHLDIERVIGDPGMHQHFHRILDEKIKNFPRYRAKVDTNEPVHFLRLDAEQASHSTESDMDVSEVFMGEISQRDSAEQSAWCFLSAIASCKAGILTDRLHVAVAASLLNVPCKMLDNNYGKNAGVYQLSIAGRFPNISFTTDHSMAHAAVSVSSPPISLVLSYCVTGQPHILERLEGSIADQLTLEQRAGICCAYKRVLITDLPRSKLSPAMTAFFNEFVCDIDAFNEDSFVGKRYFSLAKLRNAALKYALEKGFDWILLCDCDTIIADYALDPPTTGFGVPEVYWQKSETEDVMTSLAKVRSPDKDTFSKGNSWFLISARVFKRVPFNENIYGYGFEDMEFDARAAAAGAPLRTTSLRVIHRFHPTSQRAIDDYSHIRNRALFEYTRRTIESGHAADIRKQMISLPAQHPHWEGALILFPDSSRVVLWDQWTTGKYEWVGDILKVHWDNFPAESFRNDEGTFVYTNALPDAAEPGKPMCGHDVEKSRVSTKSDSMLPPRA